MNRAESFQRFSSTSEARKDLRRSSVRAFTAVLASNGGEFLLRIGSTAILARLITPDYFGLFMMTSAVTAIADQFRDLGLSTATIQREKISHKEVTNLFWINALIGLALTGLICAAAPAVAYYFQEPRLTGITMLLSVTFVLGGLTVQHEALLTRQMKQGQKAVYRLGAFLVSAIVAVVLALLDFGYWALVWREVVRGALIVAGAWTVCRWIPGLPDRKTNIRALMTFGAGLTGSQIFGILGSSLDRLLIGRFFGAGPVALYRQPYQLVAAPVNQFMSPLYQVSLPGLSMLQSDPDRFRRFFHKIAATVALVSMPLSVFLALYAPEINLLVLGKQWTGAVIYFRIFALGGFIRAVASIPGFVLVSRGYTGRLMKLILANTLVMAFLMCLGLRWGPEGVAVAEVLTIAVMMGPIMYISLRDSPVTIAYFLSALIRPAASSLLMGIALMVLRWAFPLESTLATLSLGGVVGALVLASVWMLIPGGRLELQGLLSDVLSGLRRRRTAEVPG